MCIESVISINKRINALFFFKFVLSMCTQKSAGWNSLPLTKTMSVEWYIVGGGL